MYTALIIIFFVAVLPLTIAAFLPRNYGVERSTFINRPKTEVFNYIKNIKNQDDYSKWVQTDPNMKKEFRGADGTIGFIYAWNGNSKAGEGEQEITGVTDGERITTEIRFLRPFKTTGHVYMATEADTEHSTKVTWGMTGTSPYPLNLLSNLMTSTLGNDISFSLNQLKTILENNKTEPNN